MAWTIILENEEREQIESSNMEYFLNALLDPSNNEGFKLVKYLDPYGDTVFNHLQMDDLIFDFKKIRDSDYNENVEKIIQLALKCKSEPHTYLAFYVD
jgi:hypothetical protein